MPHSKCALFVHSCCSMSCMVVKEVLVSARVHQRLTPDGLRSAMSDLWARTCQHCGRVLGEEPPSLAVDDVGEFIIVSLHHQWCRLPGWTTRRQVPDEVAHRSFSCRAVSLPYACGPVRALIINPGLALRQTRGAQRVPQGAYTRPGPHPQAAGRSR